MLHILVIFILTFTLFNDAHAEKPWDSNLIPAGQETQEISETDKERLAAEEKQRAEEEQREKEAIEKARAARKARLQALTKKEGKAFQEIPFGASFADVEEELKEQLGELAVNVHTDYIYLYDFQLGELKVSTYFRFDHKKDLYSVAFYTESYSANKLDTIVKEDAAHLTDIFKKKFGKPEKCFSPSFFEINEGYITYLCKWKNAKHEIFTGLTENDSTYYAAGKIVSRRLEKEFEIFNKEQERKKATEGAKSF